jgi:uncharacterized RDD family membrane protein YckC
MIQKSKRRERIMASLIDFFVFFPMILFNLGLVYLGLFYQIIGNLLSLLFGFYYYVYYVFKNETTIGKKNQNLFILSFDETRVTYIQCLKRYLGLNIINIIQSIIISVIIVKSSDVGYDKLSLLDKLNYTVSKNKDIIMPMTYLGQIWIFINLLFLLFEKNRRTLADYFAGTMVGRKVEDEIDTIGKEVE